MKGLDPLLQRAFSLARPEAPPEPPPFLEARVIAGWRAQETAPESAAVYHWALALAGLVLALSFLAEKFFSSSDAVVVLANSAIVNSLGL